MNRNNAILIVALLVIMMAVMASGCTKEQTHGWCPDHPTYVAACQPSVISQGASVISFLHMGFHQYEIHDGFTWLPLHEGWVDGCASVAIDSLKYTHCGQRYRALRVTSYYGLSQNEYVRRIKKGPKEIYQEIEKTGSTSVYLFGLNGELFSSDCEPDKYEE